MKIGVENVRRATRAALLAAARNSYETIAFPASAPASAACRTTRRRARWSTSCARTSSRSRRPIWLIATNHDMIYAFEDALRLASPPLAAC